MKIKVICVGKISERFYKDACNEYKKRLGRYVSLEIIEVNDEKTDNNLSDNAADSVMLKESDRIFSHIKDSDYVYALAIEGKKIDSLEFSKKIENHSIYKSCDMVFVIGGSLGLHKKVKNRADELISFSDMTFPHQLMRVILLEQIYRGYRIMKNEPYHK